RTLDALRRLLDLGAQLAAPRLELEEQCLGGLAGEPEHPALRVVAVTFARDCDTALDLEQLVELDDPQVREKVGAAPRDDDGEPRARQPLRRRERAVLGDRCLRRPLELRARRTGGRGRGASRLVRRRTNLFEEGVDGLAPDREPLAGSTQPIERRGRRLATAR